MQAPLAALAGFAALGAREHAEPPPRPAEPRALGALAFTAAAFTAVLFLLVIELVAGFAISPGRAALGVTVLPLAALAGALIPGQPQGRALGGAVLIAGGAAALAFIPAPTIAWTLVPQALAGLGMGLALPALSPERDVAEAARTLVARHVGIVLVLAILAPVATARLNAETDQAILKGASLVLDAQIDPLKKLELAPSLLAGIDKGRPRASLTEAVARQRGEIPASLGARLDDVVVTAVQRAFRIAYLIAAGLALIGAALLITAWRRPAIALAAALAAGCAVVYAVQASSEAPPPVTLPDPCHPAPIPSTGGLTGALQTEALKQLNQAACRLGVPREELALAIFDSKRAAKFEADHGVNPRSTIGILKLLGG